MPHQTQPPNPDDSPPRLGISACLLGERVRWDGGHKRDGALLKALGPHVEWVPVCPEVEAGLGVPRPPIRLVRAADGTRVVRVDAPEMDLTETLRGVARARVAELTGLHGFVFKSKSPSCGLARVPLHHPRGGAPALRGVGLFAAEVQRAWPWLPVEEETRLRDPAVRDAFVERVLALRRWDALMAGGPGLGGLMAFHARHKYQLMAHGAAPAKALGRLLGQAAPAGWEAAALEYRDAFMALLARPATPRGHANALHHVMGYLKRQLTAAQKTALLEAIEACRAGGVGPGGAQALLRAHLGRHPVPELEGQTYLHPEPLERASG